MYDKWTDRFLSLAELVASWSKDPNTKVGAVITDPQHRIVSIGFNGLPRGTPDLEEYLHNREEKMKRILHAEENAMIFAERCIKGCTLYTWPFPPCSHCASIVIQRGISTVVAPYNIPERWKDSCETAMRDFNDAGVKCLYLVKELSSNLSNSPIL